MKRLLRSRVRFAVCIKNKGYEASLEVGKLYRVIPDQEAERHGYLRIVDESGEDYAPEGGVLIEMFPRWACRRACTSCS